MGIRSVVLLSSLFWLAYRGSKGDFDGHFTWVPTSDVCMSLFYIAIIIALFISLTDGLIGFGNITMKNILPINRKERKPEEEEGRVKLLKLKQKK